MTVVTPEQEIVAPLDERLRARLEALRSNREKFLVEAQKNLAALDAAIGELSALLDPAALNGHAGGGEGDAT